MVLFVLEFAVHEDTEDVCCEFRAAIAGGDV